MEPLIVLFQELGGSPLDFCDLVRYTAVCKSWKEAVQQRLLVEGGRAAALVFAPEGTLRNVPAVQGHA